MAGAKSSCRAWAISAFGQADLPDARLNDRLIGLASALAAKPVSSLPQACGRWAPTKGAYRFLSNPRVTQAQLLKSNALSSARFCAQVPLVLCVQDTTTISFGARQKTVGLGAVNDHPTARGCLTHSTLAISEDGIVLGLLDVRSWARDPEKAGIAQERHKRPFEEKESFKWQLGCQAARKVLSTLPPSQRPKLIHVMDREGDIAPVFEEILKHDEGLVVRLQHNRNVLNELGEVEAQARETVRQTSSCSRQTIDVPRQKTRAKRKAHVEVRAVEMTVRSRTAQAIPLSLVEVWEPSPPEGAEAVHWLLWANLPITTPEQVLRIVNIYRKRWRIEEVHLALKSGCQVEELQLETLEALAKALVLYMAVAVRIVGMRDRARATPDAPCTDLLTDLEWSVLWAHRHQKRPDGGQAPPNLREAVLWIGALGGHQNRKSDGLPGIRSLWQGWRDLQLMVAGAAVWISSQA